MTDRGVTLETLAGRFGLELRGDGAITVNGVGTLERAGPGQVSFLSNATYRRHLAGTHAGAVVLRQDDADACPVPCLVAADPYVAFARIAGLFELPAPVAPGVHASAVVDPGARIAATASVGPLACIGPRSVIGENVVVGAGCVIGPDCDVGDGCELLARVTLVTRVRLGKRVRIHPGAVLGAEGFGLAMDAGRWIKVPQLGGVLIGDDCEIGANTTIDRGAIEDTVLEEDVRLDNQIQVGHNVRIGAHTAMAGCVAIAGSARIGRYCLIGGGVGIVGHIQICDRVMVTARSLVTHSITQPGEYSSGTPLQPSREWRRNAARFKQLDELARKIATLPKAKD
ncbi:MAG: UDP-3-O-(3-hydroxymyristoyl)glucosamine N-acyltransferase [Gammaproteobacteria bacterium RIFCSPHIGHO2_12_FULL_63_22]|nr:MAG: UDP-3-O-(3-hydroxymyristoyl)glucosamine N-acyltransferase [Gammaproteobacteria bacterium RIFCSPHIGHO2_12_FULL_63_22]